MIFGKQQESVYENLNHNLSQISQNELVTVRENLSQRDKM